MENREKAYDLWHQAVAREQSPAKGLDNPLFVVFEEFLDYTERHHEFETYDDYKRTLQSFKDRWPDLTVNELSVGHIEVWFDDNPDWSETTRWCYVTSGARGGLALSPGGRHARLLPGPQLAG